MQTLKNLGINILPPTKMVAEPFKLVDFDGLTYYCAKIYEFRDTWIEYVTTIYCTNEPDLKKQLKEYYNCDYFMERTLKNFLNWYQKLTHKKLDKKSIKKVSKKFLT